MQELHPSAKPPDIESFDGFELDGQVLAAIAAMKIQVPTPIQRLAIGPVLAGRDVIAKAETGTGKTLAFGAPMMSSIDSARRSVLGLVLCPTRELAQQVAAVLTDLGASRGVKVALIVGGDPLQPQVVQLKAGAQVVVATPGRILDLYQQKFVNFPWTEFAVLDEADKMFEIGFLPDIKKILASLPHERQTLLFSATYPNEVLELAREFTSDPVEVATASGHATVDSIEQRWMEVRDMDRPKVLRRLIEKSGKKDVFLIFCERRTDVDRLIRLLLRLPYPVRALHGGYKQESRFKIMSDFKAGDIKALVATDVAARGLDVVRVTHVVNYSVPREIEEYTHRIGRTGRAGREGTATTLVMPSQLARWKRLLRGVDWKLERLEAPATGRSQTRGPGRPRSGGPSSPPRQKRSPRQRKV